MNLIDIQDQLKNLSDTDLARQAQTPTGQVPQYLLLTELQRRKQMRTDYAAQQAKQKMSDTTVADRYINDAIQTQNRADGVAGLHGRGTTTNPADYAGGQMTALRGYKEGGLVKRFAEGGKVSKPGSQMEMLRSMSLDQLEALIEQGGGMFSPTLVKQVMQEKEAEAPPRKPGWSRDKLFDLSGRSGFADQDAGTPINLTPVSPEDRAAVGGAFEEGAPQGIMAAMKAAKPVVSAALEPARLMGQGAIGLANRAGDQAKDLWHAAGHAGNWLFGLGPYTGDQPDPESTPIAVRTAGNNPVNGTPIPVTGNPAIPKPRVAVTPHAPNPMAAVAPSLTPGIGGDGGIAGMPDSPSSGPAGDTLAAASVATAPSTTAEMFQNMMGTVQGNNPEPDMSGIAALRNRSQMDPKKMALLAAGAGMLSGTSPFFGVNVGQGMAAGLGTYAKVKGDNADDDVALEKLLADARMGVYRQRGDDARTAASLVGYDMSAENARQAGMPAEVRTLQAMGLPVTMENVGRLAEAQYGPKMAAAMMRVGATYSGQGLRDENADRNAMLEYVGKYMKANNLQVLTGKKSAAQLEQEAVQSYHNLVGGRPAPTVSGGAPVGGDSGIVNLDI